MRYSCDIRNGKVTHEVGVDAKTGKLLKNSIEGAHHDCVIRLLEAKPAGHRTLNSQLPGALQTSPPLLRPGPASSRARPGASCASAAALALQLRHERRLLLATDDGTLKDLGQQGITFGEATRPFWDVRFDRQSVTNS